MSFSYKRIWVRIMFLFSILGPGLITATVDNDSGGIATYSLAGAKFGFDLLWTLIPITVLLILTMEMTARLGAITGQGLADLLREQFGVKVTFWVLSLVFIANAGTVLSEFSGIASSIEIFGKTLGYGNGVIWLKYILIPLIAWGLWKVIAEYEYKKIERFLMISILFYLAYPISAYLAKPNWELAMKSLVIPVWKFDYWYLFTMVGVIGTTITPWMNFYLQSTIIEKGITSKNYYLAKWDVIIGCLTTNFFSFFMIVACAASIYFNKDGPITVSSVEDIGYSLVPLAGKYAGYLFSVGLFNASIFGAAILPLSTAFAICEGMGWERGMNKTYDEAPLFYWIFSSLIFVGAAIVLIPGANFLYLFIMRLSQVAQGLILPIFLYYLVTLGDNKSLLGEYANSWLLSKISWLSVWILSLLNFCLLLALLCQFAAV